MVLLRYSTVPLYAIVPYNWDMSQILSPESARSNSILFHDLYFVQKKIQVQTTVREAKCVVCKKRLEDGVSITAKRFGVNLRFFCQYHIPKD